MVLSCQYPPIDIRVGDYLKLLVFGLISIGHICASAFPAAPGDHRYQRCDYHDGPGQNWRIHATITVFRQLRLDHNIARRKQIPQLIGETRETSRAPPAERVR